MISRNIRLMVLGCGITLVMLALAGCGGDSDCDPANPPPSTTTSFVITEWRFPGGEPVKTVLEGEVPAIETGVQFSLHAVSENAEVIPITGITDIKFFRQKDCSGEFVEFKDVISWEDSNVGRFFRFDQQYPLDLFEVRGQVCGQVVCKKFKVLCPNVTTDP